jgi:hypothetical protein
MKTTEQVKSEVTNYLKITSKRLFIKENGEFFRIVLEGDNYFTINGNKSVTYNIDEQISWYGLNTKRVIKDQLFLNRKIKSIINFKTMKEKTSKIKECIFGKKDKSEISKIINQILIQTNHK